MVSMTKREEHDKYRFGGNREVAIQRDHEKCVRCGMTRVEHKERFGYDITVDHIDGRGSLVDRSLKNNALDNLQTLCTPCHSLKDAARSADFLRSNSLPRIRRAANILHLKGSMKVTDIADAYGMSRVSVSSILNGKTWGWAFGKQNEEYIANLYWGDKK